MITSLILGAVLAAPSAARETRSFQLYKFQQPIGVEDSIRVANPDGTLEIRTTFSFTDRRTSVPLASLLTLDAKGAPLRFQVWGSTSRATRVDDRVTVEAGAVVSEQNGAQRREARPAQFFVTSGYAPVAVTEALWSYWDRMGRPASLPTYPAGLAVAIARRGSDTVKDDEGKQHELERYAVAGIGWGRETVWIDEDRRLAALKAVDAEFDHFEATQRRFSEALPALVSSAAVDGLAALAELSGAAAAASGDPVAYVGATVIDGTGAAPIRDAALVLAGGKIVAVGPRSRVQVPAGTKIVDLSGKTLLPGLWDMHAHFEQVEWGPLYLAAGVTTVRDCGNEMDFIGAARDAIASGRGLGPRIVLACIVDGDGPAALGISRLREESEIPALIGKFSAAGCAQVKIYSSLAPRLIAPLAKAAHAAGMSVTGHVPFGIGAVHAIEAGYDQINHLVFVTRALLPATYDPDKWMTSAEYRRALAELDLASPAAQKTIAFLRERRIVVDPTMALSELGNKTHAEIVAAEPGLAKIAPPLRAAFESFGVPPEDVERGHTMWRTNLAVLRALHQGGVPIVAGTDQAVPGHSLHRELEIYVEAGFTPLEAIQAATLVPARALGLDSELGTIEVGKRADLIVVDGDPLRDIHALRKTSTVITNGRAYDTADLWRLVGFEP